MTGFSSQASGDFRPMPRPQRIAIIGAGAIGLASALYLRGTGLEVDVYDMRDPGEGASLGNAGIIAVSEVLPIGRPAILAQVPRMILHPTGPLAIKAHYLPSIAPWLFRMLLASRPAEVERLSGHLAALLGRATAAWQDLTKGSGAGSLIATNGWLRAYEKQTAFASAKAGSRTLRDLGVKVEILASGDIRDLEPSLAPLAGALFFPEAGNLLSPLAMMRALAANAQAAGISFQRAEIVRLETSAEQPSLICADGRSKAYDRIVIAAGAWSRRLLRTLDINLPLDTERGYHLMLPTPERTLSRPVSLPDPGYTLAQMTDGIRMTTGVEFAGLDAPADFRRALRVVGHARSVLPGLSIEPLSKWLGFRPSMPDSIPVIGALKRHPGIILAFGHGHLGVTLGPLTGQIVSAIATGEQPPLDVEPFSPARFGL